MKRLGNGFKQLSTRGADREGSLGCMWELHEYWELL